jgi:uncharacterized small protein (TIGR04563 family)
MSSSDKRKQSLYFSPEMLSEIASEAARQDRSLSWIVQKAWKTARRCSSGPDCAMPAIKSPTLEIIFNVQLESWMARHDARPLKLGEALGGPSTRR